MLDRPERFEAGFLGRLRQLRRGMRLDVGTGVATSVGVLPDNFAGIAFVPEPSVLAGLAPGVLAVVFYSLRRRSRARSGSSLRPMLSR